MNRWYFWVLAPTLVAAAVILLAIAPTPPTWGGVLLLYVVSTAFLLGALGLAAPERFEWSLRAVAAIVAGLGGWYVAVEAARWWNGTAERGSAGGSPRSLVNAVLFVLVFGVPALRFCLTGAIGRPRIIGQAVHDHAPKDEGPKR